MRISQLFLVMIEFKIEKNIDKKSRGINAIGYETVN